MQIRRLAMLAVAAATIAVPLSRPAQAGRFFRPRVSVFVSGGVFWPVPIGYWGGYWRPPYGYPAPSYALIDTDVSPEEARVVLDGEEVGTADDFDGFPGYLDVSPGKHVLEFRAPGFRTLRITIFAMRGHYYDIDRKLRRAEDGEGVDQMEIGPPPRSEAGPYGDDRGPRPARPRRPAPNPPPDENPGVEPGAPSPGGSASQEPKGPAESSPHEGASLLLRLRPADAAVYVDGTLLGAGASVSGPDGIPTPPGRHTIEVVKPGFKTWRSTLVLSDGEQRTLTIKLEPEEEGKSL